MTTPSFVIRYDGIDYAQIKNGQITILTNQVSQFPGQIEIESSDGFVYHTDKEVTLAELLIIALGHRRRHRSMATHFAHL